MNIQAETGLVDQVDHVKTVTKANMIMFTFLLPARQHVSVLLTMMFSSKPCAGEVWESSPRTSFKSGKGLRVARGAHHLKTATLNSLRQPLSWQWVQTISVWTRVLGSDNYSVFVNGNNPAFYGNHWEPSSCCTGCPKSKGVS